MNEPAQLSARVADAFEVTLVSAVISDLLAKMQAGSDNHRDLERSEKTLFRIYKSLTRHRGVAALEPELCAAAEAALARARQVCREEADKLVALASARKEEPQCSSS